VFTGEGDWPQAGSVPAPPAEGNAYQRCLDGELAAVLERALAWHEDHPGQSPVVRYPAEGTHSPCQTRLYGVGPVDVDTSGGDCINDESLQVPAPGIPVTVSAPGILGFANPRATVAGDALCVVDDGTDDALRTFVVVVPASGEEQTVAIEVETNYGVLREEVTLPAVDDTTTETTETSETTETTATTATTEDEPTTTDAG
jgi:hypothetical protein